MKHNTGRMISAAIFFGAIPVAWLVGEPWGWLAALAMVVASFVVDFNIYNWFSGDDD